jgi:hypothetical protein
VYFDRVDARLGPRICFGTQAEGRDPRPLYILVEILRMTSMDGANASIAKEHQQFFRSGGRMNVSHDRDVLPHGSEGALVAS